MIALFQHQLQVRRWYNRTNITTDGFSSLLVSFFRSSRGEPSLWWFRTYVHSHACAVTTAPDNNQRRAHCRRLRRLNLRQLRSSNRTHRFLVCTYPPPSLLPSVPWCNYRRVNMYNHFLRRVGLKYLLTLVGGRRRIHCSLFLSSVPPAAAATIHNLVVILSYC